jgi:hypothetical protein
MLGFLTLASPERVGFSMGKKNFTEEPIAFALRQAESGTSVTDLDTQLGRLFAALDEMGLTRNTLIIFSSDNGPEILQSSANGYSAGGSAGPFRGRKRSIYEGGVRVPFIVSWPGHVPAGRIEDAAILSGVDLMPTVCKLAGVSLPAGHAPDGEDVSDILCGASRPRTRPLFWKWRFNITGEPFHRCRIELYDIPRDPTELSNQAGNHPGIVASLSEKLLAWKETLPRGPIDPTAGKNDYPWPGKAPDPIHRKSRPED